MINRSYFFQLAFLLPLVGLVFLLPYAHVNGVVLGFLVLGLILSICYVRNLETLRSVLLGWGAFALWYAASSLWTKNPDLVWHGLRKEILYPLVAFLVGFLGLKVQSARVQTWFISWILVAGTCFAFVVIAYSHQGFGFLGLQRLSREYFPDVGDGSTILVLFSAVGLLIWNLPLSRRWCGILLVCYQLTMLYATLLTQNRMGILCFVLLALLMAVYLCFFLPRKMRWGLALLMVPVLFYGVYQAFMIKFRYVDESIEPTQVVMEVSKNDPRIWMWKYYFSKTEGHILFGYGAGYMNLNATFLGDFPKQFDANTGMHAHNVLLNKQLQLGVIGLVLFLLLYASAARPFLHRPATVIQLSGLSLMALFFCKSMTDDFFIRNNLILFWLLLGMLWQLRQLELTQDE
ncbi:O-antigen ligase [Vibrio sp. AH4]|uniref:O-antigen ligase family protein n=1 Tax=Vibrio sp. AH4 TaxID=2919577 RepID=UPI002739006C|nr:O-antigen ligase family protein [Vibrio sp. AH4]MDP4491788.1 O-antigen ligase family protein [Vibrio sp. AH4]